MIVGASQDDMGMDNTAVAEVMETIAASALQMAGVLRGTAVDPANDPHFDAAADPSDPSARS